MCWIKCSAVSASGNDESARRQNLIDQATWPDNVNFVGDYAGRIWHFRRLQERIAIRWNRIGVLVSCLVAFSSTNRRPLRRKMLWWPIIETSRIDFAKHLFHVNH